MVKRFEEVLWDELIEALLQSEELGLNASHEPPVHVEPKKINIITRSHLCVCGVERETVKRKPGPSVNNL